MEAEPTVKARKAGPNKGNTLTTDREVRAASAGRHSCGGGLFLQVSPKGARSWTHRYWVPKDGGGSREVNAGLGSYPDVTLAEARKRVAANNASRAAGKDPVAAKRAERAKVAGMTFRQAAETYIAAHRATWKNPTHAKQWPQSLIAYVYPAIGDKLAREVTTADVLSILKKDSLWSAKNETANRVRGRIELVLDAASVAEGWPGEWRNPATWRGNLSKVLPPSRKSKRVRHHAALPYADAPSFMMRLREMGGVGTLALQWTVLTAARSLMTRGATWAEIDEAQRLWIVPGERVIASEVEDGTPMTLRIGSGLKSDAELRIPLTDAAMRLLEEVRPLRRPDRGDHIFPAPRGGMISDATMAAVIKRMKLVVTVHGFRSTFRDWAAETTDTDSDTAEMALGHALPGGGVRAAYQRGALLTKRRTLMEDWADYLATPPSAKD